MTRIERISRRMMMWRYIIQRRRRKEDCGAHSRGVGIVVREHWLFSIWAVHHLVFASALPRFLG